MKIIIIQNLLYVSEEKNDFRCYIKSYFSNIKPSISDLIELPSFNNEKQFSKVKHTSINFDKNECKVVLDQLVTNDPSDLKQYIKVLVNQGWTEEISKSIS
ncbi:hypothetical protein DN407_30735 (plasmid) [Bacillus sp. JAS24-2]|uniref:hypothetical protein n=1 Tax=Bacillus sp. JAS24-2 TaxID=2217832 RepID=UPI0011EE4AF8|nr:hypothetical protein [Bacillus sp. JAS24-2]QEL82819.1 hypothetical protein DN407_30735 [Bacillus sp. JAS24-2]